MTSGSTGYVSNVEVEPTPGLGNEPKSEWPKSPPPGTKPIDLLRPHSELHQKVIEYLDRRLDLSERKMSDFYARWRVNEMKLQGYITLPDYEKILKEMNNKGKAPQATAMVIPYSFATHQTFVTYLTQVFCGRKPLFQISSYKKENIEAAQRLETLTQYNVDKTRMIKWIYQHTSDALAYGLGVMRSRWVRDVALRTFREALPSGTMVGMASQGAIMPKRKPTVVYAGNLVEAQDPFMFFPDPRVPMTEVNKRGEFVFWRCYEGKHILKRMEGMGILKWVEAANSKLPSSRWITGGEESARSLMASGQANPGQQGNDEGRGVSSYYQVDEGTVTLIPAELGLGAEQYPVKFIFTILNRSQIVRAEPLEADHDMHPVSVTEPLTLGYGFGHCGMTDYMGPIQDIMSWLVNSHIFNVRSALNNMFLIDPLRVEMQDAKNPEPGKLIRLKRAAWGTDVREAMMQLAVADVTGGHLKDSEAFVRMAQYLSGATDNVMGLQEAGGRKTATEVRTSAEAGASRLASMAKLISAQSLVDIAEQMVINQQQYMDTEFVQQVLGEDAMLLTQGQKLLPDMVAGDFQFPVSDGTLPIDRAALLDVWKQIFLGIAQSPQLSATFDIIKVFEYTAELGGARNIEDFKIQMTPDQQVLAQAQAGNMVPAGQAAQRMNGAAPQGGQPTGLPPPKMNGGAPPGAG